MPRKLTATTGVLLALALAFAGCGGDNSSKTTAQSASTATTTPATTTPATTTTGTASKPGSKKTTTSKTGASKTATGSKKQATGSKTTATTKTTTSAKKKATTKKKTTTTVPKKPVGVTPAAGSGSDGDPSSGTGSGPAEDRLAVVSVLRRYYQAFLDKDGKTACSLLTSEGQDIMTADSGAKTCAASVERLVANAGANNVTLLSTTRDGLHVNDITVTGNNATAQIGKISRLRLVQIDGHWLLRSPNVVNSKN